MNYSFYTFEQLDLQQLYAILRLRQNVFVLEQRSFYDDIDNLDQQAHHLCVFSDSQQLIAYSRLRVVGKGLTTGKIERVVVDTHSRGQKLAAKMMDKTLNFFRQQEQINQVQLSAQVDVVGFYEKWGFKIKGDSYDDGGIDHVDMFLAI